MANGSPADLPRRIGFWGGAAIMVGIIIGSGIFRTPTDIAKHLGSPAIVLALWVFGGLLSLAGGLAYAELGAMFPRSGGIYVYLHRGLGPMVAFVFGWTYMLLTKPFGAAGIAAVFAEQVNALLGVKWDVRFATCALLVGLTAVNTIGVRLGAGVAAVLTSLKIGALVLIVSLALIFMRGSGANFAATAAPATLIAALAPVMAGILWTYDGWSDVVSIAGEVKEPQRTLPRILIAGTVTVIAIYVAVNAVYIWMVPLATMRGIEGGTVAPTVMEMLLGKGGGVVVVLMILVSTAGATHGSIITGARVTFAQAQDGLLFRGLGAVHPKLETPHVSLWVQGALSCAAVIFLGGFQALAEGFVFTMWIFYALAGVAMIVLRVREPGLERPYRCPGYPVVPVLFIASAAFITGLTIWQDVGGKDRGMNTLPWLGVLAAGVPIYYVWRRVTASASPS